MDMCPHRFTDCFPLEESRIFHAELQKHFEELDITEAEKWFKCCACKILSEITLKELKRKSVFELCNC